MSFKKFVSSLLGVSSSSVSSAHHKARDDSGVRKGADKKHFSSPPAWAKKTTSGGSNLFPKGKRK